MITVALVTAVAQFRSLARKFLHATGAAKKQTHKTALISLSLSFFLSFCLFRAAPTVCGSSQARGPVGAAAAGLHHSHSNWGCSLVAGAELWIIVLGLKMIRNAGFGDTPGFEPLPSYVTFRE